MATLRSHYQHQRAAQQSSPQLHKSGVSSPKHRHRRRVSIRWLVIGLLSAAALALFCAGVFLSSTHTSTSLERQETLRNLQSLALSRDKNLEQEILTFLDNDGQDSPASIQRLLDSWASPLVHIVNTRFMQEQGRLKALGRARLHLFRTFCLPTITHQSTQDFFWIIKTDPQLHDELLVDLIEDLRPHANIYLVASNQNYMVRDRHLETGNSWRDGAEIRDILQSPIYTGNLTRLYQAILQKDRQVILETRLDADDGLHKFYLHQIQKKALDQFIKQEEQPAPKWLYWCTRRHVEWHGGMQPSQQIPDLGDNQTSALASSLSASNADFYGTLLVIEHSKLCITPGITVGFGIGTPSDHVPIHAHDKLFVSIRTLPKDQACGYARVKNCLELVEDFLLVAVRARTPTSAGMMRVGIDEEDDQNNQQHNDTTTKSKTKVHHYNKTPKRPKVSPLRMYLYWELLHDDFFILREQIKYTNQYILNHLVPIAKDNLEGQCTSDHSCKDDTKEKLLKIIEENGG